MKLIIYVISILMMSISFSGCDLNKSKIGEMDLGVCNNPKCECPKPCQCGSGCRCGIDQNPTDINKK